MLHLPGNYITLSDANLIGPIKYEKEGASRVALVVKKIHLPMQETQGL